MIQDTPEQSGRLVERLVGPADQELSCEECFDFLDAYVELEARGTGHRPKPGRRRCARTWRDVPPAVMITTVSSRSYGLVGLTPANRSGRDST